MISIKAGKENEFFTLKNALRLSSKTVDINDNSHASYKMQKFLIKARQENLYTRLIMLAELKHDYLTKVKRYFLNYKTIKGTWYTLPSLSCFTGAAWLINYGCTNIISTPFSFKNSGIKSAALVGGVIILLSSSKYLYKGLKNLSNGLFFSNYLDSRLKHIKNFIETSKREYINKWKPDFDDTSNAE